MATRRARSPAETERARGAASAIGLRIRSLRTVRGWTLEEASEAIDLDPRHLQRLETGAVSPSAVTFLRIADALGVPVATLFDTVAPPDSKGSEGATEVSAVEDVADPIETIPARIGKRIGALRRARGCTQAQLATSAGLTEQYLQRVETGRQNPTIRVLAQIARGLAVQLADLVQVEDVGPP